jgi:hypothetical protein
MDVIITKFVSIPYINPLRGNYEHGNEPLSSIKADNFLTKRESIKVSSVT